MDEQRKYAILFAATILAARKLNEIGNKPCPARGCAIADAISNADLILRRIDERWPNRAEMRLLDDAFARLLAALPERLRTFVLLLYTTGVRTGEAKKILWEHVDLDAHEIHLPGSITKNGEPRILPLVSAMVHRLKAERKDSGRVFMIGVFHKAWWSACVKAGLGTRTPGKENGGWGTYEGLIPHDLRRSALRNMRRRGISTTVAKKISGHLTDAVFERYNITSTEDLHDAANKIEAGSRVLDVAVVGSSLGQVTQVKPRLNRENP